MNLIEKKSDYMVMIVIGFLFFFLIGTRGYVLVRDSNTYMKGMFYHDIQPLYVLFLNILRHIFSEELYLHVAYILQGIIAIASSLILINFIIGHFLLKRWQVMCIYILSFLPYAYSLPEHVVSHEIMTEAISFPIFYLFFVLLCDSIFTLRYDRALEAGVIGIVLIGIRIQMLIVIPILIISFIILFLKKKKLSYKNIVIPFLTVGVLICILFFGIKATYTRGMFRFLDGTQTVDAMLGKTIYVSEEEDIQLYCDEDLKKAFLVLYNYADNEEMRYEYEKRMNRPKWYYATNAINYTTRSSWINLKEYCNNEDLDYSVIEGMQTDLMIPLIFQHCWDLVKIFFSFCGASIMAAIFSQKESMFLFCAAVTISILLIGIILAFLNKKNRKAVEFYCITIFILFTNVFFLNMLFYGLQRYVVYTYGLYYIALFILANETYQKIRSKKMMNEKEC